jgi:SAM-dependent methyltransferase
MTGGRHADVHGGSPPLVLTGERTLPGIADERYWFARHVVAYRHSAEVVRTHVARRSPTSGAVLLDAGCGEGYGADLLRRALGAPVVALDYDPTTVAHVRRSYGEVAPVRGNLVALPLRTGSVAAVVSLQSVEHLWDQPTFVAECARVLEPGGVLVLSTPNRLTFSPGAANPFHARELDPVELHALVRPAFTAVRMLGVHHGPRLRAFAQTYGDPVAAQLAAPPQEWDAELARLVHSVEPDDFVVRPDSAANRLAGALDLVAVAVAPASGHRP